LSAVPAAHRSYWVKSISSSLSSVSIALAFCRPDRAYERLAAGPPAMYL
jgi:hypothetical protein